MPIFEVHTSTCDYSFDAKFLKFLELIGLS